MTRLFGFNPWRRGDQTKAAAYEGTPASGEPPAVLAPARATFETVVFVDGVQRKDLSAFVAPAPVERTPALFVSLAAGAAVTKPGRGGGGYAAQTVERHVLCSELLSDVVVPAGSALLRYRFTQTGEPGAQALREAVNVLRNALELRAARHVLELFEPAEALLVVDGRLPAGLAPYPQVIGWIKSTGVFPRPRSWLDPLGKLRRGEYTSAFTPDGGAAAHEWFVAVRDPLPREHDTAHLVRIQAGNVSAEELDRLQAWSSEWVPAYASRAAVSSRAPQQPRVVDVLEEELNRYLGNPQLVRQALLTHANTRAGTTLHPARPVTSPAAGAAPWENP